MITLTVLGFMLATAIDLVAGVVIFWGMDGKHGQHYGSFHRFAKWILASGLLAQAARNVQFLLTGHSPSDAELPLWFLKDLGVFLIVVYWAFCYYQQKGNAL